MFVLCCYHLQDLPLISNFKQFPNNSKHFYIDRHTQLWNVLPSLNLDLPLTTLKDKIKQIFLSNFQSILTLPIPAHLLCTTCPCNKWSCLTQFTNFNKLSNYFYLFVILSVSSSHVMY